MFCIFFGLNLFDRFDLGQDLVRLPLGPQEVVVAPVVKVSHTPPKACLQSSSHQYRIVAPTDVVLVGREGAGGKLEVVAIRFIALYQELAIMLFF